MRRMSRLMMETQVTEISRMRRAWVDRLSEFPFSHAVTLGTNHKNWSYEVMRQKLKEWDARVNRELNGPLWTKRPDERLVWIAFPEKLHVNPHWHMLVSVDRDVGTGRRASAYAHLTATVERIWIDLVPSGTAECKALDSGPWPWYITKEFQQHGRYGQFVLSREFQSI